MHPRIILAAFVAAALPASAQAVSPELKKLLADYDQTTRALEIQLHDANQKIEHMNEMLAHAQQQMKESVERAVAATMNEGAYRERLLRILERHAEEDRALECALIKRKFKQDIAGCPANVGGGDTGGRATSTPRAGAEAGTASTRELLQMVRDTIRSREVIVCALLADKLGAAGQDMLDAHGCR